MEEPTINDMMEAYALDAVEFAKVNFSIELDYSNDSIEEVERIASQLFSTIPKSFFGKLFKKGPGQREIESVCKMLGGYLGEVYRKNMPGNWAVNEELGAIGINHEDRWLFPPAKVHKRLTNGEEDNLYSFFRVVLAQPSSESDA